MPRDRVTDVQNGAQHTAGFDLPGVRIDSGDATAVYETAGEAAIRTRDDSGSTPIEVQVHRRMGHLVGDVRAYCPEAGIGRAKQRDSIERPAADFRSYGVTDGDVDEMRERTHGWVEAAISWAKEQPKPESVETYKSVFTNPPM